MNAGGTTNRQSAGWRLWTALVWACAIQSVGQSARGQEPPATPPSDAVAATVGGEPIKVAQVLEFMHRVLADNKVAAPGAALFEAQALAQLIDRRLVGLYLDRRKISASAVEIDAAHKKLEDQAASQPGGLKSALAGRGISPDAFRTQLAWDVRWSKYLSQEVTDKHLQDYFDEHRSEFDGSLVRVSHLLLRPDAGRDAASVSALENKLAAIRQEIASGQLSFADAARKYSDGPSRQQGGDLGFIPRHDQMVESFSAAAFRLKQGEVSQPVATPFGLHLIQCTDIKPGTKTWQDVRDQLAPAIAKSTFRRLADEMRASVPVVYTGLIPHLDPRTGRIVPAKGG